MLEFFGVIAMKTTNTLTNILQNSDNINDLLNGDDITEPRLCDYLVELLAKSGFSKAELSKRADLGGGNYFYQLLQPGNTKKPGRNIVLSIAVGLGLTLEETQRLLKVAGAGALYPRNKFDAIIINSLSKGLEIQEINNLLYDVCGRILSDK